MKLRAVVVGIPGVGKTTVVTKLVSGFKGAKLVNFGSLMLETGISMKFVKHRDELRKLPVEKQKKLQKAAAARIATMKEKLVVVDTHLFIRTPEGFWPGLPFDVVRAMKPTHLILVEASPYEIAQRRASDSTRYRDAATHESLMEELSLARSFLATSSTLTGAPMTVVKNTQGLQDEVAESLVKMLSGASK
ncbi:MAG: adenylate kinase [Nitrososphaerota archaeon]|nr:adenylate kinase [Nitrososphaerota archaeon]